MEDLGTMVLATGALGTASFGIVEALKWTRVGLCGFGQLRRILGDEVMGCLRRAYGPNVVEYLQALYREGRTSGELPRTLRQGARIGLTKEAAGELAHQFGAVVNRQALEDVAQKLVTGEDLSDSERGLLGRFELALDARIDAALSRANTSYVGGVRILASLVALGMAVAAWSWLLDGKTVELYKAVLVGVAAVPLAPIAKDVVSALKSAGTAIGRKAR